jgi:uncharacterized membrane protein YqiK
MKRNYPRTYRSRRPLKILLTALVMLIIAVIILTLSLFFWFRRYIVYDRAAACIWRSPGSTKKAPVLAVPSRTIPAALE